MKELLVYVKALKSIIDNHYEKEMVFYNEGEWYSREHDGIITPEELCEWALKLIPRTED